MFSKLKDMAGGAAINKAVDAIAPSLKPQLEKVTTMDASIVNDDEKFTDKMIRPAIIAISAASGGVTKMIPNFEAKLTNCLLHSRTELIKVEGEKVSLVEGFDKKLPGVLMEGLKK